MDVSMILAIIGVSVSAFTGILIALRQNIKKSTCCFGEVDFVSSSPNVKPCEHQTITPQTTPPTYPSQIITFPDPPPFVKKNVQFEMPILGPPQLSR